MTLLPLSLALSAPLLAGGTSNVLVQLGGTAHDIEYDAARSRAYVTVPSQDKLVVIDTQSWTIQNEVAVAPAPHGVALSIDGDHLFVAKRGAGSVAVLDPDTFQQSTILLTTQLDSSLTYDVVEGRPDRLYVSANPSSGGFSYIVQVELDNGNVATRVANNRIIRCNPTFERSEDFTNLYVGECFSPNSLYRLDLTQPDAPIVAEDDHGAVSGTSHIEANPDSSKVFLSTGRIVDGATIDVIGQIGAGISRFDVDPNRIFVVSPPNKIQTWNTVNQTLVSELTLSCSINSPRELLVLPGETGFLVLSGSTLCGVADIAPCEAGVTSVCASEANSTGAAATIGALGEPRISRNQFRLTLEDAPAGQAAQFIFGDTASQLPFGDGWLCLSPFGNLYRIPQVLTTDASGDLELPLDFTVPPLVNGPIASYSTWYFQAWYRDGQQPGGTGLNTSDAIEVTFCP